MKVVELSGGVGGARMARGLAALDHVELTVIVNVGDDADNYGLAVSPDIDTVVYTLAGMEGPYGWGRRDDTFNFNEELGRFGVDNTFRIGDRDLALKTYRTRELNRSTPLSKVTDIIASRFGVPATVVPVTDDRLRTMVRIHSGWLTFQEYFVDRGHTDRVEELRFDGAGTARPAPGVIESIETADLVVVAPSNPPLSIWPILAVDDVRRAVSTHNAVVAVSPLIGGKTVKGPADRVMTELGLGVGTAAVANAYDGLIDTLVIDNADRAEASGIRDVTVIATDTLIKEPDEARRLAAEIVGS
ncbi:MAG TPA: 2-phospho-L-lactate transferase [Acidimicrobiia bacterium]|nr:2-phospho-L-lactate transferase [Acidimicrobiia bacterium]